MPESVAIQIVSGGQTGVDRAALQIAQELDLLCGGWCPRNRKAEDGPIPDRFPMQETTSAKYDVRTRRNVRDSDGTLVLTIGDPTGGTGLTVTTAERLGKPLLVLDLDLQPSPDLVPEWASLHHLQKINVAGPRESTSPGIGSMAAEFLRQAFRFSLGNNHLR